MRRVLVVSLAVVAAFALFATKRVHSGHADNLRAMLARIQLPPGFHIALYALAPNARSLAVSPNGETISWDLRGQGLQGRDRAQRAGEGRDLRAEQKFARQTAPVSRRTEPCSSPNSTAS